MSISFAGSRCVDERRRRRLAQEAEPESSPERRPAPRARTARRVRRDSPTPPARIASPVESLVRPQLWWNVLLAVVGLAASAGAVWLGWRVDAMRPTLAATLGLESGLLCRALTAFHFLLAAQLGHVILWYRTRSRKDFRGQFKLWRWVGPAWLLFAVASAIDGHTVVRELLLAHVPQIWHAETLCWMAPAAILVLTTTRFLLDDMREDRWGAAFVVVSGCGAATAALTVLAGPLMGISQAAALILVRAGVQVWSLAALLSMLFHARYVIHVTNEAPRTAEPGRIVSILRQLMPGWPRRNRDLADAEADDPVVATASASNAPERDKAADVTRKVASAEPVKPARSTEDVSKEASPGQTAPGESPPGRAEESTSGKAAAEPQPQPDSVAEANPHDSDESDESHQGLSKKERRRLRKQQRQQQQSRDTRL